MDNFFIVRDFDWSVRRSSYIDRGLNLISRRIGINCDTASFFDDLIHKITGIRFSPVRSGISTNVEQRMNMYHLVSQVIAYNVQGDIVEVGCNEGQSAVLMTKVINSFKSNKKVHVYDSFEGLPDTKAEVDGRSYKKGDLATTEDVMKRNFDIHGLQHPIIHKGWFDDTLPTELPDVICFAHLDGDLYESIKVSLEYVYPRLARGGICLIDDYCDPEINPEGWNHLPGVKRACDAFLSTREESMCYVYSGGYTHAFFRKL